MKHELSILYPRHVPAQHLVEGRCVIKHVTHIGHSGYIPCGQGMIEGRCVVEHVTHIGHSGDLPCTSVAVEGALSATVFINQTIHSNHSARVPISAGLRIKEKINIRREDSGWKARRSGM